MSNQDMQFVDPEWRPPEQGNVNAAPPEQAAPPPQPINTDPREQPQWQNVPPPQQQEYMGPGYAAPPPQMMWGRRYGPRPYRPYRRRSPWFWIILVLIILALFGGGGGSVFGIHHTTTETKNFSVSSSTPATLMIHESTGEITVHTSSASNSITIVATKNAGGFFSNPDDIKVNYNQSIGGNTINVSANGSGDFFSSSSVAFDVTVPTDTNLQLTTNTGTINVSNVTGTMDLESDTGTINASNDTLTGSSTLQTHTGTVNFSGSISAGNYQFLTNTGSVDVTLPSTSNFHVDASTNTGSVNIGFPNVPVDQHNVGADAHGDVGNASQATVTLKSNTGSVDLHKS